MAKDFGTILNNDELQGNVTSLCEAIDFFSSRNWCPATSSNFSLRLKDHSDLVLVSESGKDKSKMTAQDFLIVDSRGECLFPQGKKPSAETQIHLNLYEATSAQCVLHTHSVTGTLLTTSQLALDGIEFRDLELLKAFAGVKTHQTSCILPVVENSQDMSEIWQELTSKLDFKKPHVPAFLIQGHGLYAWGEDIPAAKRHVEAAEFLIEYALRGGQNAFLC